MDTRETCIFVRKQVGEAILRCCAERGYNQSQLAAIASIDRSHLNQFILGRENASLDMLVRIADSLDVPLASLFYDLDRLPPNKLAIWYDRSKRFSSSR